jgi:predicted PurR-regulated permease PerM
MTMTDQQQAVPAWWRQLTRPLVFAVGIVLGIYILRRIPMTIEVFIVATLIAYGINPLIHAMARRIPRVVAVIIVYSIFLILLLVVAIIVIPTAIEQLQNLFASSSDYIGSAQAFIDRQEEWINRKFGGHILPAQLQTIEASIVGKLSTWVQGVLPNIGGAVISVANAVVIGVTAIVLSYYFLVNAADIRRTYLSLFPERSQAKAQYMAHEAGRVFGGFVGGQIVLSTFSGVFTFFGLELIGSDYAVLLGILTGLLYAIPYLGVFLAVVLGVILGFLQSWQMALWTAAIIFLVTRIADIVLVPKVMGESVGVSPMSIIFAVFAGGELFGLWGLILAIPAAALFKVIWIVWLYPWLTGKPMMDEPPPVTPVT